MELPLLLAAQDGGVVDGLKTTAQDIGTKFGFDTQLFISQLIGFFIVAAVLYKFASKPLQNVLAEREKRIADSLAAAEKMKADLAKADEDRKRALAEAGVQAQKIIEEARAAAAAITERESQKAIATAAEIIAKAKQANESEFKRLETELKREIGRLSVQAAMRVSGKILTAEDQKRLADETNNQLAA